MSPEKQKFRSEELEEFIKIQRKDYEVLKLLSFSEEILESKLKLALMKINLIHFIKVKFVRI